VSTDNNEWDLDSLKQDTSDVNPQVSIDQVFETARERLELLSQQQGEHSPTKDHIELAKRDLKIMELTEKLELATAIIDKQKATIARLKGDN